MRKLILFVCMAVMLVVPALAYNAEFCQMAEYVPQLDCYLYKGAYYNDDGYLLNSAPAASAEPVPSSEPVERPDAVTELLTSQTDDKTQVDVYLTLTPTETSSESVEAPQTVEPSIDEVTTLETESLEPADTTWISGGSGDSMIEDIFGAYMPYAASGIASVDFAWIADVSLFGIVLVSFFKVVGGLMKRV